MREIPGFPGYLATEDGRIISEKTGNEMYTSFSNKGYRLIQLRQDKKRVTMGLHRAILLAYVGECPPGHEALHGTGGKLDNSIDNLRYGTRSENRRDQTLHGTVAKGEKHAHARLTEVEVLEIRASTLTQKELAVQYNMSVRMIGKIKRREKWTHI